MRQINIFFGLLFLFLIILFVVTSFYILTSNQLILLSIRGFCKFSFKYFFYQIILNYDKFIIFSLLLLFILFYGFSPITLFKTKHYKIFIIGSPVILVSIIFYFQNFYFDKSNYKKESLKIEKKILSKIDTKKILEDRIEFYNNKFFIKSGNKYFMIEENKIEQIDFNRIKKEFMKFEEPKIWSKIIFITNKLYPFAFLIFIIIPIALFFNNENWYLRTIIFLIIFVPLYIWAFNYFNKVIFKIKLNFKLPIKTEFELNDLLLVLIYIFIGNFLLTIADSLRNIRARIDIAKVKKISK